MTIIYHLSTRAAWQAAAAAGAYTADSLASEGFIHCSTAQQVRATATRIFAGRTDLILLCVDSAQVEPEIRYENLEGGDNLFPHIYGPLAFAAVVAVHDFPPRDDGGFDWPPGLPL